MPRLKKSSEAKSASPAPDVIRLAGGLLRKPMSVAHVLLLQRIDSPFLAPDDPSGSDKPPAKATDLLAVLYILSRSDEELDQLFFEPDRAAFHRAVLKFAMRTPPVALENLDKTLLGIFRRASTPPAE